jgi:hypothetical protein
MFLEMREETPRIWRASILAQYLRSMQPKGSPLKGAEIGVFDGKMSASLLRDLHDLALIMVDPWSPASQDYLNSGAKLAATSAQKWEETMQAAMRQTAFANGRRTILRMTSAAAAGQVEPHSLDFVFIDAVHSRKCVLQDLELWEPKIRVGGLISGHDYGNPQTPGVETAVYEFLDKYSIRPELNLELDFFWCFVKPGAPRAPD